MKFDLRGKIVIVTGASSGIGAQTAIQCADRGASVVLVARTEEKLHQICEECLEKGTDCQYIVKDISIEENCRELITQVIEKYGRIDVLINNAGVSMRALVQKSKSEVLHRLMNVNLWGPVYLTQAALPYLISSKGMVVAISSVSGFMALPGRAGYNLSKSALNGFMETVKLENLHTGLHVLVVCPDFTESNIRKAALNGNGEQQAVSPRNEKKWQRLPKSLRRSFDPLKRNGNLLSFHFRENSSIGCTVSSGGL